MICTVYTLSKTKILLFTVAGNFYITIGEDRLINNRIHTELWIKRNKLYIDKFTVDLEEISVNELRKVLPELWL